MLHRIAIGVLLWGLGIAGARAACDLIEYNLEGVVVDDQDAPVVNAAIEARWEERANGTMSNRRESDATGHFTVKVAFDPYSGRTFGGKDKCETVLERILLVVQRNGRQPFETAIDPRKLEGPLRVVVPSGR